MEKVAFAEANASGRDVQSLQGLNQESTSPIAQGMSIAAERRPFRQMLFKQQTAARASKIEVDGSGINGGNPVALRGFAFRSFHKGIAQRMAKNRRMISDFKSGFLCSPNFRLVGWKHLLQEGLQTELCGRGGQKSE